MEILIGVEVKMKMFGNIKSEHLRVNSNDSPQPTPEGCFRKWNMDGNDDGGS